MWNLIRSETECIIQVIIYVSILQAVTFLYSVLITSSFNDEVFMYRYTAINTYIIPTAAAVIHTGDKSHISSY